MRLASIISNTILISPITNEEEGGEGWDRLKRDNTRKIIRRRIHCDWQIRFLIKIILSYFI